MKDAYSIGHLEIESPWGNAGGVVKKLHEAEVMAQTGVGWIEAGSYTLERRSGNGPNGEVVYHHDPVTGETFNALGMPNAGIDAVETEIPEMSNITHKHGKSLVVNVAPVSNEPVEEARELVTRVYEAGAPAVLLNAGCPNVLTEDGGRHEILSRNPQVLSLVLEGLRTVVEKFQRPIFIRVSPQQSWENARRIAAAINRSQVVSAVFTPNTWPGHRPTDERGEPILELTGGLGGKSGPATARDARWETIAFRRFLDPATDVVSSGGITTGEELALRLRRGAAAGAGTTLFYESGNWKEDVDRLLRDYIDTTDNW